MTEVQLQEIKLDPDSELRFEVETKNEKVVLEVDIRKIMLKAVNLSVSGAIVNKDSLFHN